MSSPIFFCFGLFIVLYSLHFDLGSYTPIVYMNRAQMNKYVEETLPKGGEIMKMLKGEEAKQKK